MTIRFGILTLSDRSASGERADESGPALADLIRAQNWSVAKQAILPDDEFAIRATLIEWADSGEIDVILTTGGTGFAPRDITPEATRAVIERDAPGLAETMRAESLKKTPARHALPCSCRYSRAHADRQFARQPKRCIGKFTNDITCPSPRSSIAYR